jgi:hypothetical protein
LTLNTLRKHQCVTLTFSSARLRNNFEYNKHSTTETPLRIMSEHWKSTPKYWCKHCQCYVRDTKLERQNHEATGKHQGALKRFLRDLHRGHEREEKDKERAKREIERLNGVVSGGSSSSSTGFTSTSRPANTSSHTPSAPAGPSTEAQIKKQREQLAELGVAMPDDFRPEMAMAGEWTVTNTRVIEDTSAAREDGTKPEVRTTGVRKREVTEDEKEHEDAVRGLFKKPRKWGRESRTTRQEEDADLDALLNGSILTKSEPKDEPEVKDEPSPTDADEKIKREDDAIKEEPDTEPSGITEPAKTEELDPIPPVKTEDGVADPAPVVFKKRKAKGGMRQK